MPAGLACNEESPLIRLRLMSPLGRYPQADVMGARSNLIIRDDIAFSVVQVNSAAEHGLGAEHYSEVEIYALEEVMFFSCLALSLPPDNGMIWTYPSPVHMDLPIKLLAGSSTELLDEDLLIKEARTFSRTLSTEDPHTQIIVPPPLLGGPSYVRHQKPLCEYALTAMLRQTKLDDWLVLRGLGALC
jgi:hypothetical protein